MGRVRSENSGQGSSPLAFALLIIVLFVIGLTIYFGR